MAIFKYIDSINGYSIQNGRINYRVTGKLNEQDINWINSRKYQNVKLYFENTKDLDSYTISKINNDNVTFSIEGGDPRNNYRRKEISSLGLASVLYYFESIEKEINPTWTPLQKAMYIYNILCTDFKYTEKIEEDLSSHDLCRSLTGILYGELTCAGFATVYKEFMDRLGITCYFEGVNGIHRYNILCIDGKYYGLDVTWDNEKNNGRKISTFDNFGTDKRFYYHQGHTEGHYVAKDAIKDNTQVYDMNRDGEVFIPNKESKRFPLSFLSREDINNNLKVIEQSLLTRQSKTFALQNEDDNTRKKFLPHVIAFGKEVNNRIVNPELDHIIKIRKMFDMIDLLKNYNMNEDKYDRFKETFSSNYSLALDIDNRSHNTLDINGLKFENHSSEGWIYKDFKSIKDTLPMVKKAKPDIDNEIDTYIKQSVDYVINNINELLNKYNTLDVNTDDERHINSLNKLEIYSYFQSFIYNEENLLRFGYRIDEVKKTSNILKEAFKAKETSIEDIIANEMDFLYVAFENMDYIKALLEEYENTSLSNEEFLKKLYDINYLKQALNLSEYHLRDNDYHELFDEILNKEKALV